MFKYHPRIVKIVSSVINADNTALAEKYERNRESFKNSPNAPLALILGAKTMEQGQFAAYVAYRAGFSEKELLALFTMCAVASEPHLNMLATILTNILD